MTEIILSKEKELPYAKTTSEIINCCFEVINELGPGFQEKLYKNALLITMRQRGMQVEVERSYEVKYRNIIIGKYNADLVVNGSVIVELKCCDKLINEHQAQLFNYLRISGLLVGLLINFRRKKLEWKRLQNNDEISEYFENE